jgi:hypothetical protein
MLATEARAERMDCLIVLMPELAAGVEATA